MHKILLSILVCVLLTTLVGCKERNKSIEAEAQVVADAFTDGDMEAINKIIFGTNGFEIDDGLSDIWEENTQSQNGVLTYIFDLVTVKVQKITGSTVEYKIEAPNMSEVFLNIEVDSNGTDISQDEILQYIKNYAQNAKTVDTTVSIEYILADDEPIINYQNEEFINAITGGLLDAYKTLYSEMLEEYAEGVN